MLPTNRRRVCRVCGRDTSIDEMIAPDPSWKIARQERRICLRCYEFIRDDLKVEMRKEDAGS